MTSSLRTVVSTVSLMCRGRAAKNKLPNNGFPPLSTSIRVIVRSAMASMIAGVNAELNSTGTVTLYWLAFRGWISLHVTVMSLDEGSWSIEGNKNGLHFHPCTQIGRHNKFELILVTVITLSPLRPVVEETSQPIVHFLIKVSNFVHRYSDTL